MQALPPLKRYENQEAGGKIPSFVEFLALREQSESSHAPQMAQERIDPDPSNPISEVPNKTRSNNKKECSSKPLANIPRMPVDNPTMSMPAHTGGILLTHPYQTTLEQSEIYSTKGQEFTLKPQVERVSMQLARIHPSLADPALVNSLMKLTGMSGSINATLYDSAAPCPRVHDIHHTKGHLRSPIPTPKDETRPTEFPVGLEADGVNTTGMKPSQQSYSWVLKLMASTQLTSPEYETKPTELFVGLEANGVKNWRHLNKKPGQWSYLWILKLMASTQLTSPEYETRPTESSVGLEANDINTTSVT
ncbi:hypothetical protein Taro_024818 [Colocasia esculenta]|uniref:Uncharacterized protein n=1 Tax=Colocasia esculenta TaxID=4460 RepID=A0A843VCD8_COLES|nr:hypothetical protein [Colocasia esculenta]